MMSLSTRILRKRSYQTWFIGIVGLFGIVAIFAVGSMATNSNGKQVIGAGVEYVLDQQANLSYQQVLALPKVDWKAQTSQTLLFGLSDAAVWVRFKLPPSNDAKKHLFEIDYPMLDEVDMWFFAGETLVQHHHTGDTLPFSQRPIEDEKFIFPIPSSAQALQVLVRIHSSGSLKLPLSYWSSDNYWQHHKTHSLVMGVFFGFIFAMVALNLFFFIAAGRTSFLYCAVYMLSSMLIVATLHGFANQYFWPNSPWMQNHAVPIFANTSLLFALLFFKNLLDICSFNKRLNRLFETGCWVLGFFVIASLFLPVAVSTQILLIVIPAATLCYLAVSIWMWLKGQHTAGLLMLGYIALVFSVVMTGLDNYGIYHLQIPSHYLLVMGFSIEAFLFSLVLALDYSQQSYGLIAAQEKALEHERQIRVAQEQTIQVQKEAQESLEYNVQERTLELEIALRELSETNRELEKKNTIDALSGVRNRRYFDKKYQAEVRRSRREQTPLAIVMLDIDHFKSINDNYGHMVGDECIKLVAGKIQSLLKRPSDEICRYGGEEFALIMPGTDQQGAFNIAEQARVSIAESQSVIDGFSIPITLSAGVCSTVISSTVDESQLLAMADKALYRAKQQGRNQVCVADGIPQTTNEQA